ncbi:indole-3-glycerol phosphate synthase TrpC [Chloroflexota bacterium]
MILDKIVADKLQELEAKKIASPINELGKEALRQSPPLDFALALKGKGVSLIAEVKRASPSRGIIRSDFNPVEIARTYDANGASAISVLTETKYFQGNLSYLTEIRTALGDKRVPLLRKDFLTDTYQVYESLAAGADCLLLITAILEKDRLEELLSLSHELEMSCLVEVHSEAEMEIALSTQAKIIGINNRNLDTLEVDITTTKRLRPLVPKDKIVVSESGIKDHNDMEKLEQWGVDAVLIGESLMSSPDIAIKMRELLYDQD